MRVSIVIPAWNEEAHLARTISAARAAVAGCEIALADGGSTDATVALAETLADRVVRCAAPQRAGQMNAGAAAVKGDVLLFLHADTWLNPGSGDALVRALKDSRCAGGGFARRFDSPSPFLRLTCFLAAWRCRAFGWFLGDQAIFVRRPIFEKLGGFQSWDRFEDLDFARRMGREGRTVTLRPAVVSSARRFESEGAWRRTWRDFGLTMRYLGGGPAATNKSLEPMNAGWGRTDAR